MKFLLDENIGKVVAQFLRRFGHSASRVRIINPGIEDYEVLELAFSRDSILITSDGDFGKLIFKEGKNYCGVIFLRLKNQKSDNKIKAIKFVLSKHKQIVDFLVVTEKENGFKIRTRSIPN